MHGVGLICGHNQRVAVPEAMSFSRDGDFGVTIEDVKENTGFEVKTTDEVETVKEPTKEELDVLRGEVDRTGVLRQD